MENTENKLAEAIDLTAPDARPNISKDIHDNYTKLMNLKTVEELVAAVKELANKYLGKGLSKRKYNELIQMTNATTLERAQKAATDWILGAMGLGVVENQIQGMASMIDEDGEIVQLTPTQKYYKQLVETYGMSVAPTQTPLFVIRDANGYVIATFDEEPTPAEIAQTLGTEDLQNTAGQWGWETPEDWCRCGDPDCKNPECPDRMR